MNEQENEGTGAVEVTEPSAEALRLARTIAQLRHPPLSIDLVVLVARDIDALTQKAVEAERARIVAALDELRKPAIFGAEEARRKNRYDLKREFNLIAETCDKAIAIARGEEPTP